MCPLLKKFFRILFLFYFKFNKKIIQKQLLLSQIFPQSYYSTYTAMNVEFFSTFPQIC
jgi:hypothetical protein